MWKTIELLAVIHMGKIQILDKMSNVKSQIVLLLSKDFAKLIIIACVIAFPIALYAMHAWLQSFAYRINIEWWMFAIAGAFALLIAMFTVGFQAIKAAIANPVNALRSE